jgi:hypothetical protein
MQTYTVWGSTSTGTPFIVRRFHDIDARQLSRVHVSTLNKLSELQGYGMRYWAEPFDA